VSSPRWPAFASSQGDSTFVVFRIRPGPYEVVRKFAVIGGIRADGCSITDGIDATPVDLGPPLPAAASAAERQPNGARPLPGNDRRAGGTGPAPG
jgi:myo-inositol-hexaphosphate 3-phosphohydrolase